jgi:hypothetical protein
VTTAVQICSNALLSLGAQPINSFDDAGIGSDPGIDRARLCANLYPGTRDDLLRSHPWNCAVSRVILAPEVTAPAFDWAYAFLLPADWLRTLQVGYYGRELDYKHEGRRLLADTNVLPLRYVFRNEDESTWDAMLIELMELRMAWKLAYAITGSTTERDSRRDEYMKAAMRARNVDGQGEPPETMGDFALLNARL